MSSPLSSPLAFEDFKGSESHPLVLSRFRPRKRKSNSPPATLVRQNQPKRARRRRKSSSATPKPTSPYRIAIESSPYVFDEDFYTNNPNILNEGLDADIANYGTANNHYMKRLREAHERIIDSAKLEAFQPLNMPVSSRLMRAHLPDSCIVKDLASFFEVFLREEDYDLLATNTNKYAK